MPLRSEEPRPVYCHAQRACATQRLHRRHAPLFQRRTFGAKHELCAECLAAERFLHPAACCGRKAGRFHGCRNRAFRVEPRRATLVQDNVRDEWRPRLPPGREQDQRGALGGAAGTGARSSLGQHDLLSGGSAKSRRVSTRGGRGMAAGAMMWPPAACQRAMHPCARPPMPAQAVSQPARGARGPDSP